MGKILSIKKFSNNVVLDTIGIMILDVADKTYCILIRKETGSWATINKLRKEIIQDLSKAITLDSFQNKYPKDLELLNILFESGIVRINGKPIIRENLFDSQCSDEVYPRVIVVKYTRKCNLRCSYCYAYSENNLNSEMTNDTVLYILRKMLNTYGDKHFSLILHGGEPILRYKDMVSLIKEIHKLSNNIEVRLQTNATLVTKEIASFLKKENVKVGVSIDGFNEASNIQRVYANGCSSLRESLNGLDNLLSEGHNPGMISVIAGTNQYKLLEHFDFYHKKGVRTFLFNTFFPAGRGENYNYDIDINNLLNINLKLIERINAINKSTKDKNDYVSEGNIGNLINNLTSWERKYMCAFSPCGAGRMTLGFDTDGSIYPCDDFISQPSFCIGNIFHIENLKEHIQKSMIISKVVNHNVSNTKECFDCPWKRICTSHCASDSYFYNGTFNKPHIKCEFVKKIIPQIIDLLYNNKIQYQYFLE